MHNVDVLVQVFNNKYNKKGFYLSFNKEKGIFAYSKYEVTKFFGFTLDQLDRFVKFLDISKEYKSQLKKFNS